MAWHALLQPSNAALLVLLPTTVDQVVVWGALALLICLIAWREYTLPEIPSMSQAVEARPGSRATAHQGAQVPPARPPAPGAALETEVTPAV